MVSTRPCWETATIGVGSQVGRENRPWQLGMFSLQVYLIFEAADGQRLQSMRGTAESS